MADQISPRAKAILDEIGREPGEGRGPRRAPLASGTERAVPNNELGRLVDDVVTQTEQARLRLSALSDAIEEIAGRLGLPLEASVAVLGTGDRPAAESTPAGSGPRVPVEEQTQVLDALLTRRSAAPLAQTNPAADEDERIFVPEDTGWMAQAMRLDVGDPPDSSASAPPHPPRQSHDADASSSRAPATPRPVHHNTMGAAPPPATPAPARPKDAVATPPGVNDSARLVAVEMAVSGFSRDEVGKHLRSMYGIPEPEATLDAVFGAGTPGSSRVSLS